LARVKLYPIAALLLSGLVFWTVAVRSQAYAQEFSETAGPGSAEATGPSISSLPPVIDVGDNFPVSGSGFTSGSVINFFVATADGAVNFGPFVPGSSVPDSLLIFVPLGVSQGEGVASVVVVNTDQGHIQSNVAFALLQGDPADGLPSLTAIDGVGLSPTSLDPGIAVANIETVVVPGTSVSINGSGFDVKNGVAVDVFCDCPGGKVGAFIINPGDPGLSKNLLTFKLPSGTGGPATGPGSFRVTNLGNFFASAAVSVPLGARVGVSSVTVKSGSTVTVTGAGFCHLTVINLFNLQPGGVVNLGGLNPDGSSKIPLTLINNTQFSFVLPAGVIAGPAYVQALNPPFIPFTSSGNAPGGAFDVP
jgi:hypothetical protein